MARGINKVILVGNVGNDPELRFMPNETAVTNLSIATSRAWKNKDTGAQEEQTEWHRVVFFGNLAEIAGKYIKKGSKVYVEGSLRTNKWKDKDGNDKYTTEIVGALMEMLDSKGANTSESSNTGVGENTGAPPQVTQVDNGMDNFDDDIPF